MHPADDVFSALTDSTTLWESNLSSFQSEVASASPAPGGGAVACVTAALGMGLVLMAAEISVKPSPKNDPQVVDRIGELSVAGRALAEKLKVDADDDVRVFELFMRAWKLPRGTPEEKEARLRSLDGAAVEATFGPLAAATRMGEGLEIAAALGPLVKPSIRSDILAGVDLLRASVHAVLRGVPANLESISDLALRRKLASAAEEAADLADRSASRIIGQLQP
jgi:formiminotetrahydrofolate cyclodeaminase